MHICTGRETMKRSIIVAMLSLTLALPLFGRTHKSTYPNACNVVWSAVKDTLSVPENYTIVKSDDGMMSAFYDVKHSVHVTITGALTQRTNQVLLVAKGTGCEMQVTSNYSGFEHDDAGDFKKHVDDSLAKVTAAKPAETAKPADATK